MPSTYTGSGIELIGDGEQAGSWGDTTNNNLEILDRLTSQAGTIALSGTTHTLSLSDGTLSDGQYAVLVFGGAPSGTNTVTINPNDAKRVFMVENNSGQSVILTQGSGGNVTVADGKSAIVYCDGAGSGAAVVSISAGLISGTLDAIGALTPTDGNFIVGDGSTWVAESGNTVLNSLGVTATAVELNTMDGITSTTAELNILDGVTATTAELNYTDGVTSNIQTQLDAKAASAVTISAGAGLTGGGDLSANRTLSHADTSSQGSVSNSGTTFIQSITLDTYGHITGLTSGTVASPSDPTTAQVLAAYAGASARGVGTYTTAYYADNNSMGNNNTSSYLAVGTDVAGSSLRVASRGTQSNITVTRVYAFSPIGNAANAVFPTNETTTLAGTWRLMSSGAYKTNEQFNDQNNYVWYPHLWLRIA